MSVAAFRESVYAGSSFAVLVTFKDEAGAALDISLYAVTVVGTLAGAAAPLFTITEPDVAITRPTVSQVLVGLSPARTTGQMGQSISMVVTASLASGNVPQALIARGLIEVA